jgi:hypothetical protein
MSDEGQKAMRALCLRMLRHSIHTELPFADYLADFLAPTFLKSRLTAYLYWGSSFSAAISSEQRPIEDARYL